MATDDDDALTAPSGGEVVGRHWPCDGPYGHHRTDAAGQAIEQLVRYLNNATGKPTALPWPATSYRALSSLATATYGFDQLLSQVHGRLELLDPTKIYDDLQRPAHRTDHRRGRRRSERRAGHRPHPGRPAIPSSRTRKPPRRTGSEGFWNGTVSGGGPRLYSSQPWLGRLASPAAIQTHGWKSP
jgi:hypothetical protein